ncbi:glycosyltransferase [Mucilaginibacter sp.]|uniref:glycosyltransferase n=1 Tax=Mucilaginibacter sp. TaxID=1882438 RepID=UPI003264FDC5
MTDLISVIIPTYNPNLQRLGQTMEGLKAQTLAYQDWELIIIDNNSSVSFTGKIDLSWQPNSKIVSEPRQGLTYARLKGFEEAKGNVIVMIDDDNIANKDYLEQVKNIFKTNDQLGAMGGKSLPLFESTPPSWIGDFHTNLAVRNLGDDVIIEEWQNKYPEFAPIGAGMAVRKEALHAYINKIKTGKSTITDRQGSNLASGGDNDMVIEILKAGWQTAYYPQLSIRHIIPKERLQPEYLARLMHDTNRSWIQVLESHKINPWTKIPRWTLPLRKLKAWFNYRAWASPQNYIKWQGACGTFEGLADINN